MTNRGNGLLVDRTQEVASSNLAGSINEAGFCRGRDARFASRETYLTGARREKRLAAVDWLLD